ncbi:MULTISPECIES: MFS transporter [unclassified Streptomyces]|uniref:MFS transporter n=1 Tax=unclassified Streptomyces TaxID=2593676 RepID=UPI002E344A1F|nr:MULTISPECIES: MFS transporter [unclassified Streptomyces]
MHSSTTSPAGAGRSGTRWALVSVLSANMLIDALEVSATVVALPRIGDGLGLAVPGLQWIVSAFAAGFGALVLLGDRLVERLGRRRVYLAALLLFAAVSLAGALTDSAAVLIATRAVKGGCVALTAPTGLAILVSAVPEGPARRRAVSLYSFFGAAGFCAGLLLSGLLTGVGWRWTLAFPAPVALLLLAAGLRLVPRDGPAPRPAAGATRRALVAGLALGAAVTLLLYGLSCAVGAGREPARAGAAFAGALLAGTVFVAAERASPRPLVAAGLLRHAPLVRSAIGAATLNGSYVAFLLVAALDLHRVGATPWQTALAFLPAGAPLAVSALYSARIALWLGPARAVAAGAVAAPLGYALYPRAGPVGPGFADLLPATGCVGAAFVLAFTALHLQATGGLPPGHRQPAGALYQTCVQLGAALTAVPVAALYPADRGAALALVTAVGLTGAGVALSALAGRNRLPHLPAPGRTGTPVRPERKAS